MNNFCRACLAVLPETQESIRDSKKKRKQFKYITGIQVIKNETCPFQLCEDCSKILQISSQFKKKCRTSDKHIKNYFSNYGDTTGFFTSIDDVAKVTTNRSDDGIKKESLDNVSVCTSLKDFMSEILNEEDISESEEIIKEVIKSDLEDTLDSCWLQEDNEALIKINLEECFSPCLTPVSESLGAGKKVIDPKLLTKQDNEPTFQVKCKVEQIDEDLFDNSNIFDDALPAGASTPIISDSPTNENDDKQKRKAKYECCGEIFKYFTKYKTHCMDMHTVKVRRNLNRTIKACEMCGKEFADPSNLRRHLRVHKKEGKTECDVCRLVFKSQRSYKLHARSHDTRWSDNKIEKDNRNLICPTCGARSSNYSNFLAHRKKHEGKFVCSCTICGRGFYRTYDLVVHNRRHTGEKPYECTECKGRFARSDLLTRHMRIHTGERPFVCNECGRKFRQKVALKKHQLQCRYKCDQELLLSD